MKKWPLILLMISTSFLYSHEEHQAQEENVKNEYLDVTNSFFYFGFNFLTTSLYPELGYRYQSNHFGIDISIGANGRSDDFFFASWSAGFLVFPKPNLSSQFFFGVRGAGDYLMEKTYYSYYRQTGMYHTSRIKKRGSYWEKHIYWYPTLFVGKDYSFSKGQKIFAEIFYIPGFYEASGWIHWYQLNTFGFRVGYGF